MTQNFSMPYATDMLAAANKLLLEARQSMAQNNAQASDLKLEQAQKMTEQQLAHILMVRADEMLKQAHSDGALFDKAIALLKKATTVIPHDATPYRMLGMVYNKQKQYDYAIDALQQALQRYPQSKDLLIEYAETFYHQGDYDRAILEASRSVELLPHLINFRYLHAAALKRQGKYKEALAVYDKAIEAFPNEIEPLMYAGGLCKYDMANFEAANAYYEKALAIDPKHIAIGTSYVESLSNTRGEKEGEHFDKSYQHAKFMVDNLQIPIRYSGLLQGVFVRAADFEALDKLGNVKELLIYWAEKRQPGRLHHRMGRVETLQDRVELLDAHKLWGQTVENIAQQHPITRPARAKRQKIRVGVMSSDLRRHPVNYFVHPILETYNKDQFEFYCYSFYKPEPDDVQQYIAKTVDSFQNISGHLSDQQIAQIIANDGVDILFELGGTTHQNRAEVMAFRPAPAQVSWLGYPHSLGLASIDYLLVDPFLCPPNANLMIEKPFLMPQTWVSLGKLGFSEQQKITKGLPQDRAGHFTFGTMNNPYKYTTAWFKAVAQIMHGVPQSQFLFVRPEGGSQSFCRNIRAHFAAHGIDENRIAFTPVRGTHLQYYNNIDIALDTFPHTGGTTTCETLWMGVPVVALAGEAFFERLSHSNLHNAGLGHLSTSSIEQYIKTAIDLAHNKEWLHDWRHNARQYIRQRPLGQTEQFVRNFEQTIIQAVQQSSNALSKVA